MYQCDNVQYHYDYNDYGHDDGGGVVMITTRSILNMMNKDDYQFIKTMITTRSILNMMNIKAEYVHEWFRGDGVHGGDGPDDDIGVVHHDRSDDADDHYDHGGDGDLPVKQTWAQGGSWGSRPW